MDAKLNQSDLISLLAKGSNISVAKAEQFTKNFFDLIIEGLEKDGIVKISYDDPSVWGQMVSLQNSKILLYTHPIFGASHNSFLKTNQA